MPYYMLHRYILAIALLLTISIGVSLYISCNETDRSTKVQYIACSEMKLALLDIEDMIITNKYDDPSQYIKSIESYLLTTNEGVNKLKATFTSVWINTNIYNYNLTWTNDNVQDAVVMVGHYRMRNKQGFIGITIRGRSSDQKQAPESDYVKYNLYPANE